MMIAALACVLAAFFGLVMAVSTGEEYWYWVVIGAAVLGLIIFISDQIRRSRNGRTRTDRADKVSESKDSAL